MSPSRRFGPLHVIVISFALSRIIYYMLGISFDDSTLLFYDQILDPVLLRDHLLQSFWYQHSQPPLFNLLLGIVLKIAPGFETPLFHTLFMMMGLLMAVALFRLMVRLGVREWMSAVLTIVFIVSPAAICYENLLFYTYPIAALLCGSALFFHRFISSSRVADGLLSFGCLALVMLMRSSYHPVLFVPLIAATIWFRPEQWRRTLIAAALPVAVVLGLYAKNALLVGTFSGSSWLGANLHAMATAQLSPQEREEWVRQGRLSRAALILDPFAPLDTFRDIGLMPEASHTGIPVLDQEMKSTGYPNNNHPAYIGIAREYGDNAMRVIRERPTLYALTLAKAYVIYCWPSNHVWVVEQNRERIEAIDRIYNIAHGQIMYTREWTGSAADTAGKFRQFLQTDLLAFFGIPLLLGFGLWRAYRERQKGERIRSGTIAFILLLSGYSVVISNLFSIAENSRYRFEVDAVLLAVAAALIGEWWKRREEKKRRHRESA